MQSVTKATTAAGIRSTALSDAADVAYDAWNGLDGFPGNPYDGRTKEGRAWSAGAQHIVLVLSHLARDEERHVS